MKPKDKLWQVCKNYIINNGISCAKTIYQTDKVVLSSLELIEQICEIVGYLELKED